MFSPDFLCMYGRKSLNSQKVRARIGVGTKKDMENKMPEDTVWAKNKGESPRPQVPTYRR